MTFSRPQRQEAERSTNKSALEVPRKSCKSVSSRLWWTVASTASWTVQDEVQRVASRECQSWSQERSIKSVLELNVSQKEAKIARHTSREAKSVASRACWQVTVVFGNWRVVFGNWRWYSETRIRKLEVAFGNWKVVFRNWTVVFGN